MKYRNYNVKLVFSHYISNDNTCLALYDKHDELITVCSVNTDLKLSRNEMAIKNYGENKGMLNWLINNGIVALPHNLIQSGFVLIPICKIKIDFDFEDGDI
jgi:hypothetical protein